jgi:hypothetical protein
VLRRCADWLQRLERGKNVVVNLRPDADVETEFVAFDRPRVVRVLERIAADLDNLSLVPNDPHADKESNHHDPRTRHRHELAEPSREPKKLSHREQRTALRARWDYRQSKKIKPCVQKTERLSTILGSAATGAPKILDPNPSGRIFLGRRRLAYVLVRMIVGPQRYENSHRPVISGIVGCRLDADPLDCVDL